MSNCGCCTGIDDEAPATPANRPGMPALAYRVGTHASFMRTMLARLSSHALAADPNNWSPRPLAGLSARAADDPAIALLDAWATVADVLAFYQERVANEGYLRTATERRSVLELAHLVGYELRPGVAATAFLAYELDPGSEVEIPAGARAQSMPTSGELPQPFETAEPLKARAQWNNLRPRLKRPQSPARDQLDGGGTLFFSGTATNLRPNDPLLLDFQDDDPQLYRVIAITPDVAARRTAIALERWLNPPTPLRGNGDGAGSRIADVGALLRELARRPSLPPANARRLNRSVADAFGRQSDVPAQIIAALRPEVGRTLYVGWRNLPVTEPTVVETYALRARAAPFGHNAPPRTIPLAEGGIVTEEWTLQLQGPSEEFEVVALLINISDDSGPDSNSVLGIEVRVQLGQAGSGTLRLPLPRDETPAIGRITLLPSGEAVDVTLSIDAQAEALTLRLALQVRRADLALLIGMRNDSFRVGSQSPNLVDVVVDASRREDESDGARLRITARGLVGGALGGGPTESMSSITLDAAYPQILPRSWAVIERPSQDGGRELVIGRAMEVSERSRSSYNISGKGTQLELDTDWLDENDTFEVIRQSAVYAQSERLELAEAPIDDPVEGDLIELDDLYDGLESGRWVIVAGERADIPGVAGVTAAELTMVASVRQAYDQDLPGDRNHSLLELATPLAYAYKRASVTIYGNVVKATHGETRAEVLGSSDAGQAMQRFALRNTPLTYVAAPTPAGAESTLAVYVNGVRWHEVAGLAGLGPNERRFITNTDDESKTTVIFGDGLQGARPPTGTENVVATYRSGIGRPGNVDAGQISLVTSRPLGVRGVINPLPATGGADRESGDAARRNVPLGVTALERLVSVQDYEDFARTFAGIGKASAARLSDRQRQLVYLTIAGSDDIPIAETSDLFRSLRLALHRFGEPNLPLRLALRERIVLVISANIMLHPDYLWEVVEPKIRAALLETFSFERQELGQGALLSDAIAAAQGVEGVLFVHLDTFCGIPETVPDASGGRRILSPRAIADRVRAQAGQPAPRVAARPARRDGNALFPAELALLLPQVPDTLILKPYVPRR